MSESSIPTPHIEARFGDVAKTVLMPGDPLRAQYIAETYLEDVVCFNQVRGMLGFTGNYKGQRISVMGSGMGMPSIGIYSYELYSFYGVENIIRIGTCGGMGDDISIKDVLLASKSYSYSTFAKMLNNDDSNFTLPSAELNEVIIATALEIGRELKVVPIASGDTFYVINDIMRQETYKPEVKAGEMESFALFANATALGKRAACLLTVSDKKGSEQNMTSEERQKALRDMFEIALSAGIKL